MLGQTSCIIHEGELDAASSLAAGFKSVISVPAGANSNLSWLDRFMETHFEDLTEVIIAVDTDSAGLQLRDELINRLGAERCRVEAYGPGCQGCERTSVQIRGCQSAGSHRAGRRRFRSKGCSRPPTCTATCLLFLRMVSDRARKPAGRKWTRSALTNGGGLSSSRSAGRGKIGVAR